MNKVISRFRIIKSVYNKYKRNKFNFTSITAIYLTRNLIINYVQQME